MASRRLRRMKLGGAVHQQLEMHSVSTAADLLRRSELDLVHMLDAPAEEVARVLGVVCAAVCPPPATALELLARERGEAGAAAGGGRLCLLRGEPATEARVGAITELVGPAGAGKTQCCLQLAVQAFLPPEEGGLGGGTVYIDTEGTFSPERLAQIAREGFPARFGEPAEVSRLLAAVSVFREQTTEALLRRCDALQATILEGGVRLVVVDSVASPVRAAFDRDQLPQRQERLADLASGLKRVAREFRVPVVVTNQVTSHRRRAAAPAASPPPVTRVSDDVEDPHPAAEAARAAHEAAEAARAAREAAEARAAARDTAPMAALRQETVLSAALGVGWAHAVNTRFLIDAGAGGAAGAGGEENEEVPTRTLRVAKSPVVPLTTVRFRVTGGGLVQEGASESAADGGSVVDARLRKRARAR